MPWKVVKSGDGYDVVKKGSGEIVAHHQNEAKANAQVKALYANYDGNDGKRKFKKTRSAKQQNLKSAVTRKLEKNSKKNLQDNDHDYR